MNETHKAYLAAMIDGEGCITITKGTPLRYYPTLLVLNTSVELLVLLRKVSGCVGSISGTQPKNPRWRTQWRWQVCGRQAVALCATVAPWLILKREQAELVSQFRTQAIGNRGNGSGDAAIKADQVRIYEAMKALNLRGSGNDAAVSIPPNHPLNRP